MKRNLLLIGIPVVLAALWLTNQADSVSSDNTATVHIVADHPSEMRRSIIATLAASGGRRISEATTREDRGSTTQVFEVAASKLDDSMTALESLGGQITEQRVDLAPTTASDSKDRIEVASEELSSCFARLAAKASAEEIRQCSESLTRLNRAVARDDGADDPIVTLTVEVEATGVSNADLFLAIGLTTVVAILLAAVLYASNRRSTDLTERIDVTDRDQSDTFLRRN